ncbi:MAG TPA: Rieske (2Fe-2S) protein [Hymenobacter sp.]|nr:Rieske (2Fe-2S) protein [Hymenobacter sp.]
MKRNEFIQLFGLGAVSVLAGGCLGGCSKDDNDGSTPTPTSSVDFTLDLTAAANAPLNDPAVGYVYGANGQVIVAKTTAGGFIAVAAPCTHQGTRVVFQAANTLFFCPTHSSRFNPDGTVVNGPAGAALKRYTVTQTGNSLRVTG